MKKIISLALSVAFSFAFIFIITSAAHAQIIGSAVISLDASSPLASIVNATNGRVSQLPVLVLDVQATSSPVYVGSLIVNIAHTNGTIDEIYLYQGQTLIATSSASFASTNISQADFEITSQNQFGLPIPASTTVPLTVKVDISSGTASSSIIAASINASTEHAPYIY